MRLLLDTAAFIWAASEPERLSRRAASALRRTSTLTEISTISLAEIAIKHVRGKLDLSRDDALETIADQNLHVLHWTTDHVLTLFSLATHHSDPFDRMLIAQAMTEDMPIVTPDPAFRLYAGLKTIW